MPALLTTSSSMTCPHGGTVTASSSNTHVKAGGDYVVRASDQFTIAGCGFPPGGPPHPCVQVQWVQPNTRSKAMSDFTLSEASVGLCLAADGAPQGTVLVNATQPKTSGL